MRDFRDAKVMAHALRDALKNRNSEITHSESLELIAKSFGYDNWNILAAKIETAKSQAALAPAVTQEPAPKGTLHCSFCDKSQHEVRKLIAGPFVYICDECVELCVDIIRDESLIWRVLRLLAKGEEAGNDAHAIAAEHVRGESTEHVVSYVKNSRNFAEHNRSILQYIDHRLGDRSSEPAPASALPASSRFARLDLKTSEELRALQRQTKQTLKRYEDALRIGTTVLAERGQPLE
jgi:hypothetical protein